MPGWPGAGEQVIGLPRTDPRGTRKDNMSTATFPGYGPGARAVTVVAARVTHWTGIDYNGRSGTRIYLDTGKEVNVEAYQTEVEKAILTALARH